MKHWKQTWSGVAYDLENPTPEMVVDVDIAHALAHINRFGGHGREFMSVAEHCVLGAEEYLLSGMPASARLFLLHDAHEYVTGDLAAPAKNCIPGWQEWERKHERNVQDATGERPTEYGHRIIKHMDVEMLRAERDALLGKPPQPWAKSVEEAGAYNIRIRCWTPKEARYQYAKMAQKLGLCVNGKPWTLPEEWVR